MADVVQREAREDDEAAFELRLRREILITERFRVTLLALIPGLAMLLFLAVSAAAPSLTAKLYNTEGDRLSIGLFLGATSTYEFLALRAVERLLRTGAVQPRLRRYANAFVEVSLPTIAIVYYMTTDVGPIDALLLPPVFTYFVFILFSTLCLEFTLSAFTGLVAAVEYAALSLVAIALDGTSEPKLSSIPHHLGKASILLFSGVAAGIVARQLRKGFVNTLRSVEERGRVVSLFGQHVSPAVVDRLLAAKAGVKSELRAVCVMFVDIRNFTAFSESRSAEEVVDYLNSVFARVIESVNAHHGIVNKFLGDGCLAIFGAPLSEGNDCHNAIEAALEILARIAADAEAGALPPTRLGIALHAGEVVIGNVGSPLRKEYTVIGDVVNVASRVEALNKELGSQLLVTEEVWIEAAMAEAREALQTTTLTVRGRKASIQVYQLA